MKHVNRSDSAELFKKQNEHILINFFFLFLILSVAQAFNNFESPRSLPRVFNHAVSCLGYTRSPTTIKKSESFHSY